MSSWAEPIRPPRDGHTGEKVFHDEWKHRMTRKVKDPEWHHGEPVTQLEHVLEVLGGTPRRASVAASFIQYLGTNFGCSLIHEAEVLRVRTLAACQANHRMQRHHFLIAWTIENVRECGINSGIRLIDAVLAKDSDYGRQAMGALGGWGLVKQPEYSADDAEVIDRLCIWLGTPDGREFTDRCNEIIRTTERQARHRRAQEPSHD